MNITFTRKDYLSLDNGDYDYINNSHIRLLNWQ